MNPITILLAEDSFGDQRLFARALANGEDTHLEIVGDGREALNFLRRKGKYTGAPQADLIVVDLNLPRMSGAQVLAEIMQDPALKDIPVVVFTGAKPTKEMLENCKLAHFCIVKPDEADKYFAVVKGLVKYCRNILQFPQLTKKHAEELHRLLEAS